MEPSNVRKDDKETSDVNKGVTEAEYTGSNAGPTDGGTNDSRNAPGAGAPGVDNASAEESRSAFEDDKIASALTIGVVLSMKRNELDEAARALGVDSKLIPTKDGVLVAVITALTDRQTSQRTAAALAADRQTSQRTAAALAAQYAEAQAASLRTEELERERAAAIAAAQAESERLQAFVEEEFEELERGRLQAQVDEETKRRTAAESLSVQGEFGDEKIKPRQETFNQASSIKQGKPPALGTEVITETKFSTGRLAWLARLQQKAEGVPVSRPLHKSSSEPGGAPAPGRLTRRAVERDNRANGWTQAATVPEQLARKTLELNAADVVGGLLSDEDIKALKGGSPTERLHELANNPETMPTVMLATRSLEDDDTAALEHFISMFGQTSGEPSSRSRCLSRALAAATTFTICGKVLHGVPGTVHDFAATEVPKMTRTEAEALAASLKGVGSRWGSVPVPLVIESAVEAVLSAQELINNAGFNHIAGAIDNGSAVYRILFENGEGDKDMNAKAKTAFETIMLKYPNDFDRVIEELMAWAKRQPATTGNAHSIFTLIDKKVMHVKEHADRSALEKEITLLKAKLGASHKAPAADHTPVQAKAIRTNKPHHSAANPSLNDASLQNTHSAVTCFNCNEPGHYAANCSSPCRKCGADHFSNECTVTRGAPNTTAGAKNGRGRASP